MHASCPYPGYPDSSVWMVSMCLTPLIRHRRSCKTPGWWLTNLGGVRSKQMFLCRFVFAGVGTDALPHNQHEVLFAASKRHQVLVGVGHQRFLNTQMHRCLCEGNESVLMKTIENNVAANSTWSILELQENQSLLSPIILVYTLTCRQCFYCVKASFHILLLLMRHAFQAISDQTEMFLSSMK